MDYKEKYEAALERARMILCNIPEGESCKDIETIFPELRESEDERIRREIVNFILYKVGHLLDEKTEHRFISYLEKQKEQKPAEWSEEDEKMIERLITRLNWITYNTRTDGTSPNITFFDEIDWLKSLRPSWKPSEVHLSALLAVFNDPDNIGSQTCQLALTELYEQLKKMI